MENKKIHIIALSAIIIAMFILGSATTVLFIDLNKEMDKLRADSEQLELKVSKISGISIQETDDNSVTFILKNYNGVIGVFDQSGVLTDIIDVDIKSLPEQDRTMLEAGIWARSRQELASLIEDYTG